MFLKNNMRPAFAGATAGGQAPKKAQKNDAFMYDAGASETDDFGSFSSGNPGNTSGKAPKSSQGKLNVKAIAIAALAVVAVVLLIVLVVSFAGGSGSGSGIKYKDNAFVAYMDAGESWCVSVNGKAVATYENEIELIVAKDRSFAYIIEESEEEGYRVVITDGKETKEITPAPVQTVLATSGLKPGVVWYDQDGDLYVWNEKYGEEVIVGTEKLGYMVDAQMSANFIISDDASTVAYVRYDQEVPYVYVYTHDDFSNKVSRTQGAIPVAFSADGSLLYYYGLETEAQTNSLYAVSLKTPDDKIPVASNFTGIVDMNVAGDEIVYTTTTASSTGDMNINTFVVKLDLKNATVFASAKVPVNGTAYLPMSIDPDIAVLNTFGGAYFKAPDEVLAEPYDAEGNRRQIPIYRLKEKYYKDDSLANNEKFPRVAAYPGKFDPNGDYYYYINSKDRLCCIDLDAIEKGPKEIKSVESVLDFAVTQKGNLYLLDDSNMLKYYKSSTENTTRIADGVSQIRMHGYSNTLYFTYSDADETYCTKEGSDKEVAKFGKVTVMGLPSFTDSEAKNTYTAFHDEENDEWAIFYTSNGKSYKTTGTGSEIEGLEFAYINNLNDLLDDIIPSEDEGEESSEGDAEGEEET